MKKYAYIICFFSLVVIFTVMYYTESKRLSSDIKSTGEQSVEKVNSTENSATENSLEPAANEEDVTAINYDEISFLIKSEDGNIVVYYEDGVTLFLDTDMSVDDFELNIEIPKEGILIKNAKELFDLLETYSS